MNMLLKDVVVVKIDLQQTLKVNYLMKCILDLEIVRINLMMLS